MSDRVLTNIHEIWTMPRTNLDEEYRIQTEVVIYYFDAEWGNASGECMGEPCWLPVYDSPVPLKTGQRLAIDGVVIPQRERFVWNKTRIRVLDEHVDLKAEEVADLGKNPAGLEGSSGVGYRPG